MRQNAPLPDYSNAGVARDAKVAAAKSATELSNLGNAVRSSSATHYTTSVVFPAGETVVRVSVENGQVSEGSSIVGTVKRATVAKSDDSGLIYMANVITSTDGVFDLVVSRCDYGMMDAAEWAPAESVEFTYTIGTP